MKRVLLLFLLAPAIFTFSCGGDDKVPADSGEKSDQSDEAKSSSDPNAPQTLSLVDGHGLRQDPGDKGKWITAVSFGEQLKLTGDSSADDKGKVFLKVLLSDGKTEGWVDKKYVGENCRFGVMLEEAELYSRPNITNSTNKFIKRGELVVVRQMQGDNWTEVVAKGGNYAWGAKGWVTGTGMVSTDPIDAEVSLKLNSAMTETNPEKRKKKLQAILDNSRYQKSLFYTLVEEAMQQIGDIPEMAGDELMISGDNVNLRGDASASSEKLAQLSSGTVCKILETSEPMEVNGVTDVWYKVDAAGKTGWVFGAFTSRAK